MGCCCCYKSNCIVKQKKKKSEGEQRAPRSRYGCGFVYKRTPSTHNKYKPFKWIPDVVNSFSLLLAH